MADDCPSMAHQLGEGLDQFYLVPHQLECRDNARIPAPLKLQCCAFRAPGAAEQPARRGDRLLQRHT